MDILIFISLAALLLLLFVGGLAFVHGVVSALLTLLYPRRYCRCEKSDDGN